MPTFYIMAKYTSWIFNIFYLKIKVKEDLEDVGLLENKWWI